MSNIKTYFYIIVVSVFTGCLTVNSYSDTLYNYYTNEWELGNSNDTLKYNYYENEWSYESPTSSLEYNYYENEWGYVD